VAIREVSCGTVEEGERERWPESKRGGPRVKPIEGGGWQHFNPKTDDGWCTPADGDADKESEVPCKSERGSRSGSSPKRGVWQWRQLLGRFQRSGMSSVKGTEGRGVLGDAI
jgi:hypothetical protein